MSIATGWSEEQPAAEAVGTGNVVRRERNAEEMRDVGRPGAGACTRVGARRLAVHAEYRRRIWWRRERPRASELGRLDRMDGRRRVRLGSGFRSHTRVLRRRR